MNYVVGSLILCITILLVVVVYVIFVYICYTQKTLLYQEYSAPAPPSNSYEPLGKITPLSPQQISNRNAIIEQALKNAGTDVNTSN